VTAKDRGWSVKTLSGGSMGKNAALLLFFFCFIVILVVRVLPVMSSIIGAETRYEVVAKGFCVGNVTASQKNADEGGSLEQPSVLT
jgi:carbon starvation protein CstA